MRKKVTLNKKIGQTPLEVIEEYKSKHPKYKDVKMAYAGRLDPMAEGKLLIVIGEECKNLKQYLDLDKEYVFEILIGFKSDSQDVLGLAEARPAAATPQKSDIQEAAKKFTGRLTIPYPIFSSKTVQGKPLFLWTLENKLNEIEIPTRNVEIYKLKFLGQKKIKKDKLQKEIFKKINSIKEVTEESKLLGADFRREETRARWNEIFDEAEQEKYQILKFKCRCSSGTYMRVLAEKIAAELGEHGLAYSIKRTKILLNC
ncbi:hypothetical protein ACFLY0_00165 [Patescibacteria group bacterium]